MLNKKVRDETTLLVVSGLVINYPLSILVTWLLISVFDINNPLIFATLQTVIFTVVSWIRIYTIRYKMEKRNSVKQK